MLASCDTNHKAALQRFVEDPDIPIDNSPTEREFQNVAKLRLNVLFAGSTEGAHRACVLLGIAATCKEPLVRFGAGEHVVTATLGSSSQEQRVSVHSRNCLPSTESVSFTFGG